MEGGVIGYLPITYDLTEKGGAHERREKACGQAKIGADCHLAFGSLNAMCGFFGSTTEVVECESYSSDSRLFRCKPSVSRLDEDAFGYSQSPRKWYRRLSSDTSVRYRGTIADFLLLVSHFSIYSNAYFKWRIRSVVRLDEARFRFVADGKEVAV